MILRQAAIAIAAATFLSSCDTRNVEMDFPSQSMDPTIPAGSKIIVDIRAYVSDAPKRFDMVVFTPPNEPDRKFGFTVVGLPGETIKLDGNGLIIDGARIKNPNGIQYIAANRDKRMAPLDGIKIRNEESLGPDQYFVLGDNVTNALDSRYFGPIGRRAILGKIIKIEPPVSGQPDTRSKSEGGDKPQPESEERSR